MTGALAWIGGGVCRALTASGLATMRCDDAAGMVTLGMVAIFLTIAFAVAAATIWEVTRR